MLKDWHTELLCKHGRNVDTAPICSWYRLSAYCPPSALSNFIKFVWIVPRLENATASLASIRNRRTICIVTSWNNGELSYRHAFNKVPSYWIIPWKDLQRLRYSRRNIEFFLLSSLWKCFVFNMFNNMEMHLFRSSAVCRKQPKHFKVRKSPVFSIFCDTAVSVGNVVREVPYL